MKIEVVKLREVNLPNGTKGTILDLDDFKRLVSTYKLKLQTFTDELGFTRGLWDNTILYYNLTSQDIFSWRNLIITHDKLHLNSTHGFSRIVNHLSKSKPTILDDYLDKLIPICPNIKELWYSKISHDPTGLSKDLSQISRDILESKEALKKLYGRCRKYSKKNNVEHERCISTSLEHAVAKILDDLGLKFSAQFQIKPYHYDFLLKDKNILLEIDGYGHVNKWDEKKEKKAILAGYKLARLLVNKGGIKKHNYEEYRNKINKIIGITKGI